MKQTGRILLITAVLIVAVAIMAGNLVWSGGSSTSSAVVLAARSNDVLSSPVLEAVDADSTFTQIYNDVSPSVVAISISVVSRNRVVASGTGSGFVVDDAGYIVTNDHVVDGASQIEVEFYDGTLAWADVVGADADSDLAVLKVDVPADTLVPVTFGDSDALEVGETVLAIGSPFGQDWTLTSGIVSGLNRTIQGLTEFSIGGVIQTDAAINPGNSGGPLLNLQGQVIGVNAQIATTTESNSGVGFAIPGNLTQRVVEDLIAQGSTEYSYIGITGTDVTLSILDSLGISSDTRGIAVTDVTGGGPAEAAGLQAAASTMRVNGQGESTALDIITAIDGYSLKSMDDLISYLARATTPGQTVQLTVLRNGTDWITLNVELDARP